MNRKQEKRRLLELYTEGLSKSLVETLQKSLGFANRGVKDGVLLAEFKYARPAQKAQERLTQILRENGAEAHITTTVVGL